MKHTFSLWNMQLCQVVLHACGVVGWVRASSPRWWGAGVVWSRHDTCTFGQFVAINSRIINLSMCAHVFATSPMRSMEANPPTPVMTFCASLHVHALQRMPCYPADVLLSAARDGLLNTLVGHDALQRLRHGTNNKSAECTVPKWSPPWTPPCKDKCMQDNIYWTRHQQQSAFGILVVSLCLADSIRRLNSGWYEICIKNKLHILRCALLSDWSCCSMMGNCYYMAGKLRLIDLILVSLALVIVLCFFWTNLVHV